MPQIETPGDDRSCIGRSYARAAAAEIGLPIDEEYWEAVELDLERARTIARFLLDFPLDAAIEQAPIFQP